MRGPELGKGYGKVTGQRDWQGHRADLDLGRGARVWLPAGHHFLPTHSSPHGGHSLACGGLFLSAHGSHLMIREAFTESNPFDVLGDKT